MVDSNTYSIHGTGIFTYINGGFFMVLLLPRGEENLNMDA